jgi:hypothetical protein
MQPGHTGLTSKENLAMVVQSFDQGRHCVQIQVNQLTDVEILPGVPWSLTGMTLIVDVNEDGVITEIMVMGDPSQRFHRYYLHSRCQYPEMWRGLTSAIYRDHKREIEAHARACQEQPQGPDWLLGRFMRVA